MQQCMDLINNNMIPAIEIIVTDMSEINVSTHNNNEIQSKPLIANNKPINLLNVKKVNNFISGFSFIYYLFNLMMIIKQAIM